MRLRGQLRPEQLEQGSGLDYQQETALDDGRVVTAVEALCLHRPSQAMYARALQIVDHLRQLGCNAPDVVADYHASSTRPGGLMVRWGDPQGQDGAAPSAAQLAERFGPLPCWLQLHPDSDFDLRYRAPEGELGLCLRRPAPLGPRSRPSPLAGRLAFA